MNDVSPPHKRAKRAKLLKGPDNGATTQRTACSSIPTSDATLVPSHGTSEDVQEHKSGALSHPLGESPPLVRAAEVISRTLGVCPDVATVACLSATASAYGPSVVLETPHGELVNSSMTFLLPSQFDPRIRAAVGLAFGEYRDSQRSLAEDVHRIPKKQIDDELPGLVAKREAIESIIETFKRTGALRLPKGMTLTDVVDDASLLGLLEGGYEPAMFRDRVNSCLNRRRLEIRRSFRNLHEVAHPVSILEPVRLRDYAGRQDHFRDRGMFSLDEFGLGLEELLSAKGMVKREVGNHWSSAHDGRLVVVDGRARPADWLAGISLVSTDLLGRFITDRHLRSAGYPQRALIVPPEERCGEIIVREEDKSILAHFSRRLKEGVDFRREHCGKALWLAPDATGEMDAILREQSKICADYPGLAEFNQHRATQTLKLALLLHLSGPDKPTHQVSTDVLREARRLMARTLERTLRVQASAIDTSNESGTLDVKLEMIHAKIEIKGPMSRRQLARSFHKIDMGLLHSLVEVACDRGIIEEKGGQLRLPDKTS